MSPATSWPTTRARRSRPLADPVRVLSSATGVGLAGKFVANMPRTLIIGDGGASGVPTTATAVTGNLTLVNPSKAGYASVTKDPTPTPATSTINFPTGSVRANGVFAPLDTNHALSIVYKAGGAAVTDVILDITGYFEPGTGGLRFVPLTPSRILDSRTSAVLSGITGAFTSSVPKTLPVQGHWGVPPSAQAVTGNLTVTGQTAGGYVSATPDPTATPATSTLNFPKGDTMANGIVAPLNGAVRARSSTRPRRARPPSSSWICRATSSNSDTRRDRLCARLTRRARRSARRRRPRDATRVQAGLARPGEIDPGAPNEPRSYSFVLDAGAWTWYGPRVWRPPVQGCSAAPHTWKVAECPSPPAGPVHH